MQWGLEVSSEDWNHYEDQGQLWPNSFSAADGEDLYQTRDDKLTKFCLVEIQVGSICKGCSFSIIKCVSYFWCSSPHPPAKPKTAETCGFHICYWWQLRPKESFVQIHKLETNWLQKELSSCSCAIIIHPQIFIQNTDALAFVAMNYCKI